MTLVNTSLDAWTEIKSRLGKIHTRVYDAIVEYPDHTTAELSIILHIPTQTMAGRPGELLKKGLVKRIERRICLVTKNGAWTWREV